MQTAYTVLILLMLVSVSRLVGRVIPLPLPLVQIAAGALLAWPTLGLHVALDPELFLFLFLPPLLFSDGWRMPKRALAIARADSDPGRGPCFVHRGRCRLFHSLAVADDSAASSLCLGGRIVAHRRRSGFSDCAEPLADAADAHAAGRGADERRLRSGDFQVRPGSGGDGVFSLTNASLTFVAVALGGLAVGVALSWLVGRLRVWMIARGWDDPATHVVFMLLLPFAAYVLAERLGASGILSAVAAGMMQSWLDLLPRQTSTRLLNRSVWSLLEFAFNGLIFLLLGLQLPDIIKAVVSHEPTLWPTLFYRCLDVLAIFLALVLLRFVWVQSIWRLSVLLRRLRGKGELTQVPTARSCWLLTVGGVRGAVTLAGVMSVPMLMGAQAFPERDLLIFIAAGVILLSLVSACIALPLLLRGIEKARTINAARKCAMPGAKPPKPRSTRWKPKKWCLRMRRRRHCPLSSRRESCPSIAINSMSSMTPPKPRPWRSRWICWNVGCV